MFGTARVDLRIWDFRSLHFLALVFATIRLVCFVVQEKEVGKNSCFGVSLFRCFAVSWFSNARARVTQQVNNAIRVLL